MCREEDVHSLSHSRHTSLVNVMCVACCACCKPMRMARTMGRVVNGYNLRYRTTRQSWTTDFAPGAPLVSHSEHMPCCRRLRLAILCNIANMTSSEKPEVHIDASTQIRRKSVPRWRRGVVVSGVRRMNEVNPHRARLVLRAGIPSRKAVTRGGCFGCLHVESNQRCLVL